MEGNINLKIEEVNEEVLQFEAQTHIYKWNLNSDAKFKKTNEVEFKFSLSSPVQFFIGRKNKNNLYIYGTSLTIIYVN